MLRLIAVSAVYLFASLCVAEEINASKSLQAACFNGLWRYDADASDDQARVIKKLQRQIKQQASAQYHQQQKKNDSATLELPNHLPRFAFLNEDLSIRIDAGQVALHSASLQRDFHLGKATNSFSLKQFQEQDSTVVASFNADGLKVDSKMLSGLSVYEVYQLQSANVLRNSISINDGINPTLRLQRYFKRDVPATLECL